MGGSDVLERFRREAHRMAKTSAGVANFDRVFRLLGGGKDKEINLQSLKCGLDLIGFRTSDRDIQILMNRCGEG